MEDIALFVALTFWAIVFGIWAGLSGDDKPFVVKGKPTERPPAEVFENE